MKFVAEVAVPFGVVTLMGPVVAVVGTVAVILVEVFTVKVAATPLNVTEVAPVKFVPLMVTEVPADPLVGVNDVMVGPAGVTTKLELLVAVPCGVMTWIAPVPAVVGTTAVIRIGETTVKLVALTPPKRTAVAPWRSVPLIVTVVPGAPDVGVNEVIVGGLAVVTKKLVEVVVDPSEGTFTVMGPVVAPVGTVAVMTVPAWLTVKVDCAPLNSTRLAPVKFVPLIVTLVPTGPLVGVNDEIVGGAARAAGAIAIPTI